MKKSINSLNYFFFKSSEVFKFWVIAYIVCFLGILSGIIVAAFSGNTGLAILLISAVILLLF